jgi:DNA-binding NarL/FixJ family response regulator
MIDVVVVDDHAIVRHGLEQLIATTDDLRVVASVGDGAAAIAVVAEGPPDIVLMDLSMPVMDGVEATRRIVGAHPGVCVVVLTSFGDQRRVLDALEAGAVGYLLKGSDPEEIIDALRSTAVGGSPLDPLAAKVLLRARHRAPEPGDDLTDRESQVLALVADGLSNKQIAQRLGITERTVKAHLGSVFQRIGVTDRTQAALWARARAESGG